MKKILILLVALCCTATMYAQKRDVIYLKNGSVVKGTINEIADSRVTLTTKDGSMFIFAMDEVERISKDTGKKRSPLIDFYSAVPAAEKLSIGVTAGYLYSSNNWAIQGVYDGRKGSPHIKPAHGFTVGATGEYRFVRGFGVAAGAMASMSGYTYQDKSEDGFRMQVTNYSLDIPLNAVFYFGRSAKWHASVGVRPVINVVRSISLSDSLLKELREGRAANDANYNPSGSDAIPLFNIGAQAGVGFGPVRLQGYYMLLRSLSGDFAAYLDSAILSVTKHNNAYGASLTYTYKF